MHGSFGALGDERTWFRLRGQRVVVPDLLGYGEHSSYRGPVTMHSRVDHLREALGDEPVHMVGHSVGAVIATPYARRSPSDVIGLIDVEGNLALADAFWSATLAASVVDVTGAPDREAALRQVFARTPVHLIAGGLSRADRNVPRWALEEAQSYTEIPGVGHLMMFQRPEDFGDALAGTISA